MARNRRDSSGAPSLTLPQIRDAVACLSDRELGAMFGALPAAVRQEASDSLHAALDWQAHEEEIA